MIHKETAQMFQKELKWGTFWDILQNEVGPMWKDAQDDHFSFPSVVYSWWIM